MKNIWVLIGIFCLTLAVTFSASAQKRIDILNMSAGTVVLSYSGEYSDSGWTAMNVFDGNPMTGWSSPSGKPNGNYFLVELPQAYRLSSMVLDNANAQESGYPGISSRSVEVWASATGPDSGFRKVATVQAVKGGRKEFALPQGTVAQWMKIVVATNWGHPTYTELMEAELFGTPIGSPAHPSLTGVYRTNYGPLSLLQQGNLVTGCYQQGTGIVSGAANGRVLNFEWRQSGNHTGTAMMVLDSRGKVLNGVWYNAGQTAIAGEWVGTRDPNLQASCTPPSATVNSEIKQSGRAILYGVHFNSDSSKLLPDSDATLQQIAALMKGELSLHLRVEGYTDSTNTDAYNLNLSSRRAEAVIQWLTQHGVATGRLVAKGFGKSSPVADNNTPQGRALNRRVEIVVIK